MRYATLTVVVDALDVEEFLDDLGRDSAVYFVCFEDGVSEAAAAAGADLDDEEWSFAWVGPPIRAVRTAVLNDVGVAALGPNPDLPF